MLQSQFAGQSSTFVHILVQKPYCLPVLLSVNLRHLPSAHSSALVQSAPMAFVPLEPLPLPLLELLLDDDELDPELLEVPPDDGD